MHAVKLYQENQALEFLRHPRLGKGSHFLSQAPKKDGQPKLWLPQPHLRTRCVGHGADSLRISYHPRGFSQDWSLLLIYSTHAICPSYMDLLPIHSPIPSPVPGPILSFSATRLNLAPQSWLSSLTFRHQPVALPLPLSSVSPPLINTCFLCTQFPPLFQYRLYLYFYQLCSSRSVR